jgi:hypothetical protein
MSKKTLRVALGVVLVVSFSILLFILWDRSPAKSEQLRMAEEKVAEDKMDWDKKVESIKALKKSEPKKAEEKIKKLLESLPAKAKRYYEVGLAGVVEDIKFYGLVVDQFDQPVAGAKVSIDVGGRYLASGSGQAVGITNSEGRFSVKGEGGSLYIGPITHPGIDSYRQVAPNGKIEGGVYFTSYQHREGGSDFLWTDYTDKGQPFEFKVWRKKRRGCK